MTTLRKPKPGQSLADLYPDVAVELDEPNLDPRDISQRSPCRLAWKCRTCGHRWVTRVVDRTASGNGCPECDLERRRKPKPGQSLADLYPAMAAEIDEPGLDPRDITVGSARMIRWRCRRCAHRWTATPNSRTRKNSGCILCARRRSRGAPSTRTTVKLADYPEIAAEMIEPDVDPHTVSRGSTRKLSWQCAACSHVWATQVRFRIVMGNGCPECARDRLRKGVRR